MVFALSVETLGHKNLEVVSSLSEANAKLKDVELFPPFLVTDGVPFKMPLYFLPFHRCLAINGACSTMAGARVNIGQSCRLTPEIVSSRIVSLLGCTHDFLLGFLQA